jgi:lantibiotic modifying enzyme
MQARSASLEPPIGDSLPIDERTKQACRLSWCCGAPGVGLGRLRGLRVEDTPEARSDIEQAVAVACAAPAWGVDHWCCGGLGRAELLFSAGLHLSRPDLADRARRHVARVIRAAERTGSFILSSSTDPVVNRCFLGLFQGVAGIGYSLLRLHHPATIPSVLIWD